MNTERQKKFIEKMKKKLKNSNQIKTKSYYMYSRMLSTKRSNQNQNNKTLDANFYTHE